MVWPISEEGSHSAASGPTPHPRSKTGCCLTVRWLVITEHPSVSWSPSDGQVRRETVWVWGGGRGEPLDMFPLHPGSTVMENDEETRRKEFRRQREEYRLGRGQGFCRVTSPLVPNPFPSRHGSTFRKTRLFWGNGEH